MLSYDMDNRGDFSLYEYLYRCIKSDILTGALGPQDHLPSKRHLADHLGVSLITVENAYRQLVAEGYVYALPRRGYYVSVLPGTAGTSIPSLMAVSAPEEEVGEASPYIGMPDASRPIPRSSEVVAQLWGKALRATLNHESEEELFRAQPVQGSLRLRRAIVAYLAQARGMHVSAERVVVGAGAQMLYTLLSLLWEAPSAVALENPGYPRLKSVYEALGHQVVPVPMDAEGMSVAQLEDTQACIAHVMPSHQFPTGRVMSIARRYELLSWAARQEGRYIVEDDYDWEFRLSGRPIPSLQSIDVNGKVIYVSTFSKSLSSSLRVAFAVLPPALAQTFTQKLGAFSGTVSTLDQVTLAHLLESGDYERHVNRYRKQSKDLRDQLIAALDNGALRGRLRYFEQESGLHFVMQVKTEVPEQEAVSRAQALGVRLAPLSRYLVGPCEAAPAPNELSFVVQYDGIAPADVPRIVAVLEQVL